jgi:hypothetical protein
MQSYAILHNTPGRVRLAVPAIVGSAARARACEDALLSLPGVRRAQANDRTGSVLVHFIPTAVEIDQIREQCALCAGNGWPCPHQAEARDPQGVRGGSIALALTVELLPRLLPLVLRMR